MNERDATEIAYKNGYEAGVRELAERVKSIYERDKRYDRPNAHTLIGKLFANIDDVAEELTVNYESSKNDKQRKEDEGK